MTGSAIAGRITPGSAGAQLEACSRERWASAEGTDKNMCRIGGWYALFSAVISQYNSFRLTLRALGPDAALYARPCETAGPCHCQIVSGRGKYQIKQKSRIPKLSTKGCRLGLCGLRGS
jgi:hypothetical protein